MDPILLLFFVFRRRYEDCFKIIYFFRIILVLHFDWTAKYFNFNFFKIYSNSNHLFLTACNHLIFFEFYDYFLISTLISFQFIFYHLFIQKYYLYNSNWSIDNYLFYLALNSYSKIIFKATHILIIIYFYQYFIIEYLREFHMSHSI